MWLLISRSRAEAAGRGLGRDGSQVDGAGQGPVPEVVLDPESVPAARAVVLQVVDEPDLALLPCHREGLDRVAAADQLGAA